MTYPAKQALLQVPARFPRQKHPSSPLLLTVGFSIAGLHPTLLATRQKVVEPKHIDINDEQDKARPHDQQPETGDCEKEILRMSNALFCALHQVVLLRSLGIAGARRTEG